MATTAKPKRKRAKKTLTAFQNARPAKAAPVQKRRNRSAAKAAVAKLRTRRKFSALRSKSFIAGTVMPSAIGATGALALDVILAYLPLPAMLKGGALRPVVRLGGALALGFLASKVASKNIADQVTAGAVTVVLYDLLKGSIQKMVPTLQLGDDSLEYINPGMIAGDGQYPSMSGFAPMNGFAPIEQMGQYVPNSMGEYVPNSMGEYGQEGMGEYDYN